MADNTRRDAGNNKANETSVECASLMRAADTSQPETFEGSGLIARTDANGEGVADDLDSTAEFPVLVLDDALEERVDSDEGMSAELRAREAAVQGLLGEAEARDTLIGELRRQIDEQTNAQLALKTDLDEANARIADLSAAHAAREIDIALAQANLQVAREAVAAAESNRVALAEEMVRLREAVDRHAEAATGAQRRYEDEAKVTSNLRTRLQELETYIDGAKQRWLALNNELTEYRDWLGVSQRREAWALAELTAETKARKRLATEAADLQRRLVNLVAQLAEREITHRELERRIEEERAAAAQLRANVETASARGERALAESNARAAALEQSLSERQAELRLAVEGAAQTEHNLHDAQQRITRLEALLREAAHEIDGLVTAAEEHESTIARLESDLRERQDAVGVLEHSVRRLDPIGIDTAKEGRDRVRKRPRVRDAQGSVS